MLLSREPRPTRRPFWRSSEGNLVLDKGDAETVLVRLEFADVLPSAVTISSAVVAASGCTATKALAGSHVDLLITGSGTVKVTVTLSNNEVLVRNVEVRDVNASSVDY